MTDMKKILPLVFIAIAIFWIGFVAVQVNGIGVPKPEKNISVIVSHGISGMNNTPKPPKNAPPLVTNISNHRKNQNQNGNNEENNTEVGNSKENNTEVEVPGNKGINHENEVVVARNITELKEIMQIQRQRFNHRLLRMKKIEKKIYKNQNKVREAVFTLLAMKNLTGGIGKNVSKIAREFNNSVQKTIKLEERIHRRSGFIRFFIGGDRKDAKELENLTAINEKRIQKLEKLKERINNTELKQILDQQIQNIQQEQERLRNLAQKEKKSRGIFGWLFR